MLIFFMKIIHSYVFSFPEKKTTNLSSNNPYTLKSPRDRLPKNPKNHKKIQTHALIP